ncbi:hypothetical protein GJ496_011047 [Pomphorhynchus laevis]|nr:hypothetical protein GJ496_011047 [Pomphorhynchus laevis]
MHSAKQGCKCLQNLAILKNRNMSAAVSPNKINLSVNGIAVSVDPGTTIMKACQNAGFKIPHFCYHARLAVAGNCRMCLVEVEKNPKPVASCAMSVLPGMKVLTDSQLAKTAREGILEFILANHPLDCPICDQGGECDLQDLSMYYGNDRTRFTDIRYTGKRSVIDKDFGPLIKTSFTKCIHCTRCVRFANEVAGICSLGTTGRGNDTQIGMYIDKLFMSELSGNVIDLCPVGALTSKPYAFTARPWETRKTESIDVMDGLGSNITVYSRSGSLLRILPRLNEDINEEWISDKARFSYDGLTQQRLVSPMIRLENKSLVDCDWFTTLNYVANKMSATANISAVVGDLTDCETIVAMKDLLEKFNSEHIFLEESMYTSIDLNNRSSYIFNTTIAGVEDADMILLVNTNPRYEAPLLNARIRKAWLNNSKLKICYVGPKLSDLTYDVIPLGDNINRLYDIAKYTNVTYNDHIQQSHKPMLILGTNHQDNFDEIYKVCWNIASTMHSKIDDKSWNPFNLLHRNCNTVGALDLGCKTDLNHLYSKDPQILFLLNCDTSKISRDKLSTDTIIVYIGHQGDYGASIADVILPGSAYTEKNATYVNTEGRIQLTKKAVSPPGIARDDWKIIRALSEFAKCSLPYDDHVGVTRRLIHANNQFAVAGTQNMRCAVQTLNKQFQITKTNLAVKPFSLPLMNLSDYWMTNTITRSSAVMSRCVKACNNVKQQITIK